MSPPPANRREQAPVGPVPAEGWTVGVRVWVERAGQAILGPGRLELLEGIQRHHSITAAAHQMGMSYRRGWGVGQSNNQAAGEPLVVAATRGAHRRRAPARP